MTDKQINRWLRRQFSPIGWLLLFYYGLMTLLTSVTAFADMARQALWDFSAGIFSGQINWNQINGNAWGYVAAIATTFVIVDAWKGSGYRKQTLLVKNQPMTGKTFLCMLVFCMGAQMVSGLWILLLEVLLNPAGKSVMPVLESVSGSSDTFSMFLYASLLAPVWEELLFRGYILRTLQPFGKRFAVLTSAFLFGVFHGNLLQAPYALIMGLLLGYITVEYSLVWAVLLHMFNNLVLADLLTRLTASWSELAYGSLNLILFGGSAVVSLLILLKHRFEIRACRKAEWVDRRCLRCFFFSPGILILTVAACVSMMAMFLL